MTPLPALDPDIAVVADVVPVNARRCPDGEAVVHGSRRVTWRQLDDRVARLANGLRHGLDVGHGERICILAGNSLEYYELFHGTAAAGVVAVPLNQRLAFDELRGIAERVQPRALFHDGAFREQAEALRDALGTPLVAIGDRSAGATYDGLLAAASAQRDPERPAPPDAATICFTGGTTGLPKGCVLSHGALVESAGIMPIVQGLRPRDRHLFVRPMAVAPGHRMVAWHGYLAGTTIVADRFDPSDFYRLVEEEHVNASLLSPTMFQMLLDEGNTEHRDLSSLAAIAYGGAPITPDLLAQVLDGFRCELHQSLGGTEAAIATHLSAADHLAGRLDSVGREAPGVEVRIVDAAGNEQPTGTAGEILVRSGQLFTEYWNDPATTADALRDGFYWSGDLGVFDADRYLSMVGRTKDLIISGGYNVYPIEVENVIAGHPAVREVAVIGVPHPRWGEAVHAVVVLHHARSVTADELVAYCRSRIASYKKPQSIEFVDELPRTTVGKVAKNLLRDRVMAAGPR